jgi:hypothetical protein
MGVTGVCPAALLYALTRSNFALLTAAEAAVYLTPVEVTCTEFIKVAVGEDPRAAPLVPEMVVGPVLVIPEPANTANFAAVPIETLDPAALANEGLKNENPS